MANKRKEGCPLEISDVNDDPTILVDRNEILKLTKVAKSWEFTCSFCFKKFPSAQAMGGHQNAHRSERLEERRLVVRDPIGYRKRAYLRSMKADHHQSSTTQGVPNPGALNLHAAAKMVKRELANINASVQPKILAKPVVFAGGLGEVRAISQASSGNDSPVLNINGGQAVPFVVMNFLPPKELSLVESVGADAEDAKGKACIGRSCEINLDQTLDLSLKL